MKKENKEIKDLESIMQDVECDCGDCDDKIATADEIATMFITPLCKANLQDVHFDEYEFQRGVNEYSYIAGKFAALMNIGLTAEVAFSYIVNIESAILTKEMNIEMAKHGVFAKDKESL